MPDLKSPFVYFGGIAGKSDSGSRRIASKARGSLILGFDIGEGSMSRIPDIETSARMYAVYQGGSSLEQVGVLFGVSRQSVYDRLRRRGMHLRRRAAPRPFVDFDGKRYALMISGHYKNYYRETTGSREMLHRAVWRKANGGREVPRRHVIHIADNNRKSTDPDNMECLPKGEDVSAARRMPIVLKRCLACGRPMGRRYGLNHSEGPTAYAKRGTCNAQCSADWKRGKPRGTRMQ